MDLLNKRILLLLDSNCRMTYRSISEKVGITANAVKNRIESMIEDGTIVKFNIMPTLAMAGISFHFGIIETDSTEDPLMFMEEARMSGIVAHISQLAYGEVGGYAIVGQYRDHTSLASALSKIRRINGVRDIEFHNAVTYEGAKTKLTNPQKRILRVIVKDPRMSISDIADETGLSARRVRKEIDSLTESNAFHFGLRWNLSIGLRNQALVFTHYKNNINVEDYLEWLYEEHELEVWASIKSAIEPIIMTQLVTESMSRIPEIISAIRKRPEISHVRDYVVYRTFKYPWLADTIMNDILA